MNFVRNLFSKKKKFNLRKKITKKTKTKQRNEWGDRAKRKAKICHDDAVSNRLFFFNNQKNQKFIFFLVVYVSSDLLTVNC